MRSLLLIATVMLLSSCSKESILGNQKLTSITLNNSVVQSFQYNANDRLVKENFHGICDHPSDEFSYTYNDIGIQKIESTIRSIYSSTSAICNLALGIHAVQTYEYDDQQRVKKIISENSTTNYTYNSANLIVRADYSSAGSSSYSTYKYDSRNNLVEEYGSNGLGTIQYKFDDKKNPYYEIKSRPDIITAFNTSPNNVIKIFSSSSSQTITYEYNLSGFPIKMFDSNGSTYVYNYGN